MEGKNALLAEETIVKSGLMREESRGAHFGKGFSQTYDHKWKGNILLKKSAGGRQWTFQSLREKIS
jgi:succinate dehydrogenase/fumarate reductase flavoprotein subunit